MAEGESERPAAHVVARRMALAAGCGGSTMAGCALVILAVTNDGALRGGAHRVLLTAAIVASGSGAWCALLALAEAAALRVHPSARLPLLASFGAGAAALMAWVYVWVRSHASGGGSVGALRLSELLIELALGAPAETLAVSAAALAPFVAIGGARTLPVGGSAPPWPMPLELVLAMASGLVTALLLLSAVSRRPQAPVVCFTFVSLCVAASVGLRLADRVEAAVRYRLTRSRSEEES